MRETGANCSKSKTCWIGVCERTALGSMSGIAQAAEQRGGPGCSAVNAAH